MAQSNGVTRLRRMEFEYNGHAIRLEVNPEEFTQEEPSRITVTQTKGGAWADDFGAGVVTISMKGTTGFKGGGDNTTGFNRFLLLRSMIRDYNSNTSKNKELVFYNYTDEETWIVVPDKFVLMRSVSRPLLYLYNIQLTCLRGAGIPNTALILANSPLHTSLSRVGVGN